MSEQNVTTIVAAVVGFFTVIAGLFAAYFMAKLKQQGDAAALQAERDSKTAEIAADNVKKVADTLEATTKATDVKLNKIAVVADATHKLVNSAMTVQLQLVASALRRVATLTHEKDDELIASEAEDRLYAHQSKQLAVDSQNPGGVPDAGDKN